MKRIYLVWRTDEPLSNEGALQAFDDVGLATAYEGALYMADVNHEGLELELNDCDETVERVRETIQHLISKKGP